MKKYITLLVFAFLTVHFTYSQNNLYDFKVKDIDNNVFDFATLKGKKVMIVNVASKCGFTPQYAQLEELYKKYKDKGFVIVGFPSNDFEQQEPGTNADIKKFCTSNYGVTFPMMSKISVKGKDKAPIYKWLTQKSKNGKTDSEVLWNFQKYLIDEDGNLVDFKLSKVSPMSIEITQWIED